MRTRVKVTTGGQISIPAQIRRRWATDDLVMEDLGDRVVVRPMPTDPIAENKGVFASRRRSGVRDVARLRREEQQAERRKFGS
jgi:bifunctional DNA-binding transcriptional regulator/antitoxin component of YhaV-PrlF toxin-antitoxin module